MAFKITLCSLLCWLMLQPAHAQTQVQEVAPGIKKITFNGADTFNPYSFCTALPAKAALAALPAGTLPFDLSAIKIHHNARGLVIEIPLADKEHLYGFGLQMNSFDQRGLRVKPIVNDNPLNNLGYTHAPLPYYVSTAGYGVLVNTSRYTTFYCGSTNKSVVGGQSSAAPALNVADLYKNRQQYGANTVTVDVPGAEKIEIYIFTGPDLKTAVQRYNLYSGGGALPPMWALAPKYRVKADFNQDKVLEMAAYFRSHQLPFTTLGLEPGWQTASYSCSYVWDQQHFPQPQQLIDQLKQQGFKVNLWEHAFVSPKSPLFTPLKQKAGNYLVWNGLVPDFADQSARSIFAGYHQQNFADKGISGFKLDECDNSNLAYGSATWSFPELSEFPSGISGEQMHQLYGVLYQKTIFDIYQQKNQRTLLDVRASNAFASSYPAALYSDTYEHEAYIRMVANTGFSGLLWTPEIRESSSVDELTKRIQTGVLSAQTVFNCWYLAHPPWLQIDKELNNKNVFMPDAASTEAVVQKLLQFRMRLLPYLYNAFARYHLQGVAPFRALVTDYPQDEQTYNLSDEYLIGDDLLAAPFYGHKNSRSVYLPKGMWYDYNTNKQMPGGKTYVINYNPAQLPVFVKSGTILPLAADAVLNQTTLQHLTCTVYGKPNHAATLFEDDGQTFDFEKGAYNIISLTAVKHKGKLLRQGNYKTNRYVVDGWTYIP